MPAQSTEEQSARVSREILVRMPLLRLLEPRQLDRLAEVSRLVRYPKRATLVRKGQNLDHLAFLVSGRLQVVDYLPDGREIGLNMIQAGGFFGELSVIDRRPRSATLVALAPTVVIQVPGDAARRLFFESPPVAEAVMQHLARSIRRMSDLRALQAMPGAFQRVFALLNYLSEPAPGGIKVIDDAPTHQEISIMVNTSRETVTRALSQLLRAGVVDRDHRRLVVRDPAALERLIEDPLREPDLRG
jgi:CRP/FNR family cyclic AMP-dependent transcriptional regulator